MCWAGLLTLAVVLAPALAAIWLVPWFVTQDGPAHIYNAQIIAESFDPNAPSRAIYTISWKPIPNWVGHIILTGLVSWLPAWVADRIMTSATLVGLAAAVLWLRTRVAGRQGIGLAALFSALLAMNVTWLLGFTSFLLGSCLFPIGLGIWWKGRYRLSIVRIAVLSVVLCFGFFCHLVSLGLLAVGLVVLSLVGPVPPSSQAAQISGLATGTHFTQLHSASRAGVLLFAGRSSLGTDLAGMGRDLSSVGKAGLG